MSDQEFDVVVPDIPMPTVEQSAAIKDDFTGGFRFSFVGSGQGGNRIAATFLKLGYKRVCCINTADQDMANIRVADSAKLCIGGGGAGKNPAVAKALIKERKEDVLDFMRRSFGPEFDRTFVCIGAGGGTGAGTAVQLVDISIELQKSLKCEAQKVGVIVALPKASEGKRVNANAYNVLNDLCDLCEKGFVSPLIILDNEKIGALYPTLAVDPFWDTANMSVCSLFHLFNIISTKNSTYSTFDRNDLKTVLDAGLITFGATPVERWQDATDISYAVRNNLKKNILSGGIDLSTGTTAGAVVIGGQYVLTQIPQLHLDHAFDQLNRMLKPGSTVHRGIYRGNQNSLIVYTAIGGLARPDAKLEELKQLGDLGDATQA